METNKKVINIGLKIIKLCFIIFSTIFLTTNIIYTPTREGYEYIFSYTPIIVFLLSIIILYLMYKYINKINISKGIYISLFILLVYGLFIIFSAPINVSLGVDADDLKNAAFKMLEHDYSGISYKSYVNMHPHQLGLLSYYYLVAKLFNNNFDYIIRVINLLITLISIYYLYKINNILFNNELCNKIFIILILLFTPLINISFDIYSYSISYGLGIISIYYFINYIRNNNIKYLIISLMLLIITLLFKYNNVIILIGYSIYLIIKLIEDKKIISIIVLGISLLIYSCISGLLISYYENIGQTTYDNKLPTNAYLAYGLNHNLKTPGMHFSAISNYHFDNDFSVEYTTKEANRYILEFVDHMKNNKIDLLKFINYKLALSYSVSDGSSFTRLQSSTNNNLYNNIIRGNIKYISNYIWDALYIIIGIGLIVFCINKRKEKDIYIFILSTIIIGGFLYHLLFETKPKYLIQYITLLIPYASYGINKVIINMNKKELI